MDSTVTRLARLRADIACRYLRATGRCRRRGARRLDRPPRAIRAQPVAMPMTTGIPADRRRATRVGGDDGDRRAGTQCDGRPGDRRRQPAQARQARAPGVRHPPHRRGVLRGPQPAGRRRAAVRGDGAPHPQPGEGARGGARRPDRARPRRRQGRPPADQGPRQAGAPRPAPPSRRRRRPHPRPPTESAGGARRPSCARRPIGPVFGPRAGRMGRNEPLQTGPQRGRGPETQAAGVDRPRDQRARARDGAPVRRRAARPDRRVQATGSTGARTSTSCSPRPSPRCARPAGASSASATSTSR